MIHRGMRTKGGTMPLETQEKVDVLLDEFVSFVNEISDSRHLQRGIARSSLPCSIVVVLDRSKLLVIAQFRPSNLSSMYISAEHLELAADQALSKASWEFGFEDPFLLQFPADLLDMPAADRADVLRKMAEEHVDSEFLRFMGMLSMLRLRPAFGPAPYVLENSCAVLSPEGGQKVYDEVAEALDNLRVEPIMLRGITGTDISLRQAWRAICSSRLVVADLTDRDADVMYGLGIAHAVGKPALIIHTEGERVAFPGHTLPYSPSDMRSMRTNLEKALNDLLGPILNL
ncbi:MAG TPA: hypothetical protein PK659_01885 [Methanothrix sp.]|nr:hypothetical protein [Methanothrix sp.]HOK58088.1 hypothetical protein [Methanothrix sp.]HOL42992.1 hypothetical protein [Methanothrix sp.]HPO87995.1 hypothetical protein [Methanothrix sp.]